MDTNTSAHVIVLFRCMQTIAALVTLYDHACTIDVESKPWNSSKIFFVISRYTGDSILIGMLHFLQDRLRVHFCILYNSMGDLLSIIPMSSRLILWDNIIYYSVTCTWYLAAGLLRIVKPAYEKDLSSRRDVWSSDIRVS
ncbi:hypothetical protein BDQ17DRAFT_1519900 [Cyathus striatus]|nr:hypothetical protein BDQ17DRAFT_1519900 [Cyathus striatus]